MSGPLEGKVAVVTGASRGIGLAVSMALADEGAEVVAAARSLEAARASAEQIRSRGGSARAVSLDISSDASVESAIGEVVSACGKIAILVNNAGITRDNLLLRMKREEWSAVLDTNLTGIYRMCRAVVPGMVRARFGRIINVTSVVARFGNPGQVNYAASKAGIEGFTRSLAREIASRGVTVNCVAPGFIDTDMTRDLPEEARARLLEQIPMQRLGTGQDVASAVVFLAGDRASYVTGVTLDVNGGMYM